MAKNREGDAGASHDSTRQSMLDSSTGILNRPASGMGTGTSTSFYSQLSPLGRKSLGVVYQDPSKFTANPKAQLLLVLVLVVILGLMTAVAYYGGFHTVESLDRFEDAVFWQRLWSSSIPLWSVLMANVGLFAVIVIVALSKPLFLRVPRKPLALLTIGVMCVTALVLFLHPLDAVFYPGMLMLACENYLWVLLMVQPDDLSARFIHPFLHSSHAAGGFTFTTLRQLKATMPTATLPSDIQKTASTV